MLNPGLGVEETPATVLASLIRERAVADGLWTLGHLARSQVLFDQDNAPSDVFILARGLLKLTYLTPEGDERIKSFIVDEGLFAVDPGELSFGARALEPSTLVRLPLRWVRRQISERPDLQRAKLQFSEWVRRRKSLREQALLCESAAERYRTLQAQDQDLIQRLPQGDIARYLGITPIAFSRIKRRLG